MKLYTDVPAVTRRGKHYDPAHIATSHLPKSLFRSLWIRFVYVETLYSVIIFRKEDDGGYTLWAKIEQASLDSYYNEVLPF